MVAFLVLLERKILGLLQLRKGPNIVGFYGLVQTVADGIKLVMKEILFTKNKRVLFFFFAPVFSIVLSLSIWEFLPRVSVISGNVLLVLILSSISVFVIIGASWGSDNVYALIRGVRATAQMCSYEVVIFLFMGVFLFISVCLDWEGVILFQSYGYCYFWLFGFFFFFVWLRIILAELNRTPFDLVERESELVGGFNVEYASFGFTLFFLAEYINIWFMSFLTCFLFFPFMDSIFHISLGVFCVVVLNLFLRGLLPRFKFFDLIFLTWGVFLPVVLFVLLVVGFILFLF